MKYYLATIALAVFITGCATERPPRIEAEPKAGEIENAQQEVRDVLIDPESARFYDMHVTSEINGISNRAVCGKVNSKNRMGGYVGRTPFYVKQEKLILQSSDGLYKYTIERICKFKN